MTRCVRLCAVLALVACGGGGGSPAPHAPAPSAEPTFTAAPADIIDPPSGSIYLGAFVNTSETTIPSQSDMTTLESEIGRKLALTQHYYGFNDSFPTSAEQFDVSEGRVPIESWGCSMPNAQVAAGAADAAIAARANALRKFGHPIFVRYMWEMNNPSTASYRTACYDPNTDLGNGYFSPSEFVAAWQHIHAIFVAQGAANVIFLWNPAGTTDATAYYPGGADVDWVGVDKYDYGTASFALTFTAPYQLYSGLGKPMMIGETGSVATQQVTFFTGAAATLQSQFPLIHAWIYFDANGANDDWRILGNNDLAAFATMAQSPYLSAMPPL